MIKIKRALISVSDKTGLVDFAKGLHQLGVEMISTGGTAQLLRSNHIPVKEVSDYTKSPMNTCLGRMRYALINLRRLMEEQNVVLRHA